MRGAKPAFGGNCAPRASFSIGETDLKADLGVRALHARLFNFSKGVLEPPRSSDCSIVVVSEGLGSTRCEEPCPVLVVTELRELVFQLERPT